MKRITQPGTADSTLRNIVSCIAGCLLCLLSVPALSSNVGSTLTLDGSDVVFNNVGDFSAISSSTNSEARPGSRLQLIKTQRKNSDNSVVLGDLYDTLFAGGVKSANSLVLGFAVNESQQNPYITLRSLDIDIERNDGSKQRYSLGGYQLQVKDTNQGKNRAEARLQIDLGFDFFDEYDADSTRLMIIRAQLTDNNGGADRIFLSSRYTANAMSTPPISGVPLPASLGLFAFSLGLIIWRKGKLTRLD